MCFNNFEDKYLVTSSSGSAEVDCIPGYQVDDGFLRCVNILGGKTFNNGLYRMFRTDQIIDATKSLEFAFPAYEKRVLAFGYDWLGRISVLDILSTIKKSEPLIRVFEPGAGENMVIPTTIIDYHEIVLVEDGDAVLSSNFYQEWRKTNFQDIEPDKCVGYKVPLFLGGEDWLENLEVQDLDVYISTCAQLLQKTKDLKPGDKIDKFSID